MRKLLSYIALVLITLIIPFQTRAAFNLTIELSDKSLVTGEFIEIYHDRWFYEQAGPHVAKFILLFEVNNNKPDFYFHPLEQVKRVLRMKEQPSKYKRYLKEHNLYFKNHLVSDASVLTGNEGHHKLEKMYGNFAWDIGILDENKSQFEQDGSELENYYIFEKDVLSPLSGLIVGKVDGEEDNTPDLTFTSDLSKKTNNFLTIKVSEKIYLSVVHFKKNSITVDIGDEVAAHQVLGQVGNSGVSYIPHLHYTLYTYIKKYDRFISIPGFFEE